MVSSKKGWKMIKKVKILGITFSSGNEKEIIDQFLTDKGYIVVPAAPSLVLAHENEFFNFCLKKSNYAILDSGLLVVLDNLFKKNNLCRFSGLKYFRNILNILPADELQQSLWILPATQDIEATQILLKKIDKNINLSFYVAPTYTKQGSIEDKTLINMVYKIKPQHIFIALGGGTQERLAYFLNSSLKNSVCIHCIGAALGFLNGTQVYIPSFIDKIYMGWLWRCLSNPVRYFPRYLKSLKLMKIYLRSNN